jgi:hypothetical protein
LIVERSAPEQTTVWSSPAGRSLEVFRQAHLKPQDLQSQVGVLEQSLAVLGVLGRDQGLEQPLKVPLDPLAEPKAVAAGEPARGIAGPENEIVSRDDHDQFLLFSH